MNNYNNWAKFYDQIYVDRSKDIQRVLQLIQTNASRAKTVLDLACGTGKVTESLSKEYVVEGLDLSEGLISIAKENYPNINFHLADMSNFELNKRFDVVVCLFNSINHLGNFENWISTFETVKKHLNDDGVFIFDMNTRAKFEKLVQMRGGIVNEFGNNNYRIIKVLKEDETHYSYNMSLFENKGDNNYKLHSDKVIELEVPADSVKKELHALYNEVKLLDKNFEPANKDSNSIIFVCK